MKYFLMLIVIVWFVLGISAAHDRGYFDANARRTCSFVGSASLTVIAGGLNYVGVHPKAFC